MNNCTVEECDKPHSARGFCNIHYQRWLKYGNPLIAFRPRLAPGEAHLQASGYMKSAGNKHEHVAVAERVLGKPLPKGAVVHHANGNKADNRPANLVICPGEAYHQLLHRRQRARDACGHPDWRRCVFCGQWDAPINLSTTGRKVRHRTCENLNRKQRRMGAKNDANEET